MAKELKIEILFNADTQDVKVTGPVNARQQFEMELFEMGVELARRAMQQHNRQKGKIILPPMMPSNGKVQVPLPNLRELLKNGG